MVMKVASSGQAKTDEKQDRVDISHLWLNLQTEPSKHFLISGKWR